SRVRVRLAVEAGEFRLGLDGLRQGDISLLGVSPVCNHPRPHRPQREARVKKAPILFAVVLAASSGRAVLPPPRALDHVLAAHRHRIDGGLARFPARAGRIPKGATVPDLSNVYVLDLPSGSDVAAAAARYAADPDVIYAQPDYVVQATFTPNDPFFSSTGSW